MLVRNLFFVLALVVAHGHTALAQSPTNECPKVNGKFLVEGQMIQTGIPTRPVYYLEQVEDGISKKQGHYFAFNLVEPRTAQVAIFRADGSRLFEHSIDFDYVCKNSVFIRESEVAGGGEGCSKTGRMQNSIILGPDGALSFVAEETWDYGFLCFSKPSNVQRLVSFKPYRQNKQ